MKIGFIVGKKDDTVADQFYDNVADLPLKYHPKIRGNHVIPVDAAIAWYIHKKYNVDVDILKPNTLTKKKVTSITRLIFLSDLIIWMLNGVEKKD